MRPDGLIAVIELPNRLVDTDYHTSLLPFFDQLPEELALAYVDRSPRADFRQQMLDARAADADGGRLALARWGTGASFHEFELVFGDLSRHVVGGGYDPMLLGDRKVHADETALARYLEGVRPDLPPFSRYWIDIPAQPDADRARGEPADPSLADGDTLSRRARSTRWETIALPKRRRLRVEAPAPTRRVVCADDRVRAGAADAAGRRPAGDQKIAGEPAHPIVAELELERDGRFISRSRSARHRASSSSGSSCRRDRAQRYRQRNERRPDPAESVAGRAPPAGWSDEIASGTTGCDARLQLARGLPAQDRPEGPDPDPAPLPAARSDPPAAIPRAPATADLDPGCRQRSVVARRHPPAGRRGRARPVDPLAGEYNALLDRHGVPPVRTRPCAAESVADVLGEARFDLVYCQNALDHTEEPLAGLEQMVRAVKPGRWVLLKHVIDEGEHEGYVGLHDWNFRIEDGRFVIWNRETRIYPDERLPWPRRRARAGGRGGLHLGPGRGPPPGGLS